MTKTDKFVIVALIIVSAVSWIGGSISAVWFDKTINAANISGCASLLGLLIYVRLRREIDGDMNDDLGENYTNPSDPDHKDDPKDWLSSALVFVGALSHLLEPNEGIVVKVEGDMNASGKMDFENAIVFRGTDERVHVIECEDAKLKPGDRIKISTPDQYLGGL